MTDVEFTPLPDPGAAATGSAGEADLTRLTDVTVELTVEVGRTHMSLGETMSLGQGSVVTLDRLADKPVDLLVNGRPIARGEVVVIDEQFGLRITEVNGAERGAVTGGAAAAVSFEPEALAAADAQPGLPEAA
jgi:flagellar motor switch protein FliN/FliY